MSDHDFAVVVGALVPALDPDLQSYLGGILAEEPPVSAEGVTSLIGELLLGYEVGG